MADEELLDGDEEQKDPEAEQNQEQDSAQEQAPEGEASESAENAPEEPQGEVAVDQEEPDKEQEADQPQQEADQPQQESEGESSEDESVDDLVEQQMLAELEKLEPDEETGADQAIDTGAEEAIEQDVQRPEFPSFGQTTSASEQKNLDLLLDVNLPISIELGRTSMKIKEILSLGPGSVVELKKLAGEPVDLLVNNKIVAKGEVVVVDENFGLRITSLLSPEERLRSLE